MQQCALLIDGVLQVDTVIYKTTSRAENMRGLLWHKPLTATDGIWLEPCSSIHTLFMTYSIDVVFVDKRGVITKICHALKPWRMAFGGLCRSTVEFAAGTAMHKQLTVGQTLQCTQPTDKRTADTNTDTDI